MGRWQSRPFLFCQKQIYIVMNFIVGKKLNMSQHFTESGEVIPVTVLKVPPMTITQVKTVDKDSYTAVQVGISSAVGGSRKANKPLSGHLKKSLAKPGALTEFRVSDTADYEVGKKLDVSSFQVGEMVNCVGIMKGRGFAGAMKRHGFAGFPASHGHDKPRSVGSIGQRFPQHVRKGMRMAGHMGTQAVTVKNLQVVDIDPAKNLISVRGAVPGTRGGMVRIISTGKVKPIVKVEEVKEEKKKK
jgi:large subunit ribosomal protein L3